MTRNRILWLVAMLGLLAVTSGVILAQKSDHVVRARAFAFDDGEHAWLGVHVSDVASDKVRELKLPGEYGAVVDRVEEDSPAAKAGLEKNDVILEFAGERVWSAAELRRMIRETPPGRTVNLRVSRAGQARTVTVKLEARGGEFFGYPPTPPIVRIPPIKMPPFEFHLGMGGPRLGIQGDDLTSQLADYFGVKGGKGVLVREVKSGSAAEKAGLKAGDCIVEVDGKEVGSVEELRDSLGNEEKREHSITIVRDRHPQTVKVEIEPPSRLLRPETAGEDDLENLDGEIAELRDYAPEARAQAETLRRELEGQAREWQAQAQNQRAELERMRKELTVESERQLKQQTAEAQQQVKELRKQIEQQSQQWKKDYLDQQMQLEKELQRELLDLARQAPVI